MPRALLLLTAALATAGCGAGLASHVDSEDAALGRVVVYRNGIAYYERRATATGDTLVLEVPHDKVDDFLKSLTVTDAATGDTVPVSYPTAGASKGSVVEMTLQLPAGTRGDLVITYITDAPAWKPSYRVVVSDDGKLDVQGWAIVDNTSGEDWTQVRVGVGSSSALSFRYDLRSVMYVHRETLGGQQAFAVAPPTGGSVHGGAEKSGGVVLALGDDQIFRPAGHPDVAETEELLASVDAAPVAASRGRPAPARNPRAEPAPAPDEARLRGLAERLKKGRETVTVRGYAQAGESPARALDRANMVRNRMVELGVAPDRVVAESGGRRDAGAGVDLALQAPPKDERPDDGQPVGESHFESKVPMTIARGTSAMVAVLDRDTEGEVVYLFDPDSDRGHDRFAFRAVRFRNPSTSTLEAGPVTVYGEGRFIGEGLTDSIPPEATTVIPFALDRQVVVDRENGTRDEVSKLLSVDRGVVTAEVRHIRRQSFEVTNRSHRQTTVFLRQSLPSGWTLGDAPKAWERRGESYLFAVELGPEETKSVAVEAWTPLTRTVDLRSPVGVDLMRGFLARRKTGETFDDSVRAILTVHDEMASRRTRIQSLRDRMAEYRERQAELTTQLERLTGDVWKRPAGVKLRSHLESKLAQISDKVQKATLEVVEHQEQLMLARIRFQDAAAELNLEQPTVAAR